MEKQYIKKADIVYLEEEPQSPRLRVFFAGQQRMEPFVQDTVRMLRQHFNRNDFGYLLDRERYEFKGRKFSVYRISSRDSPHIWGRILVEGRNSSGALLTILTNWQERGEFLKRYAESLSA